MGLGTNKNSVILAHGDDFAGGADVLQFVQKFIHDIFFADARSRQKKRTLKLIIIDKEIDVPRLENQ